MPLAAHSDMSDAEISSLEYQDDDTLLAVVQNSNVPWKLKDSAFRKISIGPQLTEAASVWAPRDPVGAIEYLLKHAQELGPFWQRQQLASLAKSPNLAHQLAGLRLQRHTKWGREEAERGIPRVVHAMLSEQDSPEKRHEYTESVQTALKKELDLLSLLSVGDVVSVVISEASTNRWFWIERLATCPVVQEGGSLALYPKEDLRSLAQYAIGDMSMAVRADFLCFKEGILALDLLGAETIRVLAVQAYSALSPGIFGKTNLGLFEILEWFILALLEPESMLHHVLGSNVAREWALTLSESWLPLKGPKERTFLNFLQRYDRLADKGALLSLPVTEKMMMELVHHSSPAVRSAAILCASRIEVVASSGDPVRPSKASDLTLQ